MVRYSGDYSSEKEDIHGETATAHTPEGDITECTRLEQNFVIGLGTYDGGRWIRDNDNDQY